MHLFNHNYYLPFLLNYDLITLYLIKYSKF